MIRKTILLGTLIVLLSGTTAMAEGRLGRKYEIVPYGGMVWSRGYDVLLGGRKGTLKTDKSGMAGVIFDVSVGDKGARLELIYDRQDTEMYVDFSGERTHISDMVIEYYHIGALWGVDSEKSRVFTSFSLGATHFNPKEEGVNSDWYFSIMLGFGLDYYFSERFGLRFLGRLPYTLLGWQDEFICIEEGCLKSAGGRGMWQFDLSLGLIIGL